MPSKSPRAAFSSESQVSANELRRMFNQLRLYENNTLRPGLSERLRSEGTPDPAYGQPPGTRSQMVEVLNEDGLCIALVRRYVRQDGTVAASGREDPKWLIFDGIYYRLAH